MLSLPARRAVRKLGEDIGDARRRRRIQAVLLAERAGVSRATLTRIERGEPGVSLGNYAAVLHSLGMVKWLSDVADARHDRVGLALADEHLPKRVRRARTPTPR